MVLPGIQALFGFQLVTVFEPTFSEKLPPVLQTLHFVAIGLTALSVAAVLAPAAYHRLVEPMSVSPAFIKLSTRLLLVGMLPLAIGICLDFFIIGHIVLHSDILSAFLSLLLLVIFLSVWLLFPISGRKRHTRKAE